MKLMDDESLTLTESLIKAIQPFVSPFRLSVAPILDRSGECRDQAFLVLHSEEASDLSGIPIDSVAAIFACYDLIRLSDIQDVYARVEKIKSLEKQASRQDPRAAVDMTTAFVVARRSDVGLERIAAEMAEANKSLGAGLWPDALGILSQGIINYTAEVPGRAEQGDFLLPANAVMSSMAPAPLSISLMMRASGASTLNKIASLSICRAAVFDPSSNLPDYRQLLAGMPDHGVPVANYQYDLSGTLRPRIRQQDFAAILNFESFNFESGGKELGSVQYRPWQDGGVLLMRGRFPLLPLLLCVTMVVPQVPMSDLQYVGEGDLNVSFVLPMSRAQFIAILGRFASVMREIKVVRVEPEVLIRKVGDEGSSSPYVARLMIGVMELRDVVFRSEVERREFDGLLDPVLSALKEIRESRGSIVSIVRRHVDSVRDGRIVSTRGSRTYIEEAVDAELQRELNSLLITSVRVTKNAMQTLMARYGTDIGFLFGKETKFKAGIVALSVSDFELSKYLEASRAWLEPLIEARNELEHIRGHDVSVGYDLRSRPVEVEIPMFLGLPLPEYAEFLAGTVAVFVEEVLVHTLASKMPRGLQMIEVPLEERDPDLPKRFRIGIAGDVAPWCLKVQSQYFEQV